MDRNRLPLKSGMLSRKRIHKLLEEGLDYPLVSIVGGPGYGKTQAVAQFIQGVRQRVIWLNLTHLDNNSDHFWHTLVSSIGHELPDFASGLRGQEFPSTIREFDMHLIKAAGALEFVEDTVLVIDNFNVIDEGPVSTFLETLMRAQLARLCIFLISADVSDLHFSESLVGRDCLEVAPEQLRFTHEEADLLFKYSGGEIGEAGLGKIMLETEGWPLAIYLVCKQYSTAKTARPGIQVTRLPMVDRLFESSYFEGYPLTVQRLLIGFAFLPSFSLEMASSILTGDEEAFAGHILQNVFVSYDYTFKTFAFHPMYQDFLRRRRHAIPDAEMARIYSLAGVWFHGNARFFEAVDCYFNCAKYDEMMTAILSMPIIRMDATTSEYLISYFEKLPNAYLAGHPQAQFCVALLYLNRMEARKAKQLLLEVEQVLLPQQECADARQMLGEVYATLADISLMMNDDGCFGYYPKAAALLDKGSRFHNRSILHIGNNNTLFLPGNTPGLLQNTVDNMIGSVTYSEGYLNGQSYGAAHLFAAEASYAVGDMALAKENCYRAIFRAQREEQHDIICNTYFLQLRCAFFEGDNDGINRTMADLSSYYDNHDLDMLGEIYDNARGWLYLRLAMPEMVPRWISEYDNSRYAQQPVAMGRNKIVCAHYLLVNYRYRECIAYLDGMEWIYREKGLWTIRWHHYIIKAICLANIGNKDDAVAWLHKAYEMTYANGMIMGFVEYGNMIRALVTLAANQDRYEFSSQWLSNIKDKAAQYAESIVQIKKIQQKQHEKRQPRARLSKREHEVLELLVKGATRSEIARLLGISVNSVKTHMAGLYSKLGAVNKADATRIAIRMGIVDDRE